jgi:CubicO group peptidase (beta-lactamase class C family)
LFPPGASYDYSNTNKVLLGLVVETVSHELLAVSIKRHVLGPEHVDAHQLPASHG